MKHKSIFIAATGQNVGKTTICLGIIAGMQKRFPTVGFIKPVGQQHVQIDELTKVDKDVVLFKQHFCLSAEWKDMSPVIIPSGFTRNYLDEKIHEKDLLKNIVSAYHTIAASNHFTIVEGTGHVGVGTIVNLNNALVAGQLGLEVVIISSGGLGSAHDELALNIAMCKEYGVKVRGVILNRVLDDKREMILNYFPKTLKKWGIPLIGAVPYNEMLSRPTVKDFANLFNTKLIAGEEYRYRHFRHTRLVAGSLEAFEKEVFPNELVITPASREDIIMANINKHIQAMETDNNDFAGGMILTDQHPPSEHILEEMREINIPSLYVPHGSYDAMKRITSFTAKIRTEDILKIQKAIHLVEQNLEFDLLC